MKPTLLVLAAGMGSRYGGLKQIDPVGPSQETIIDYSIYDAIRAGFGKVVFIIRHKFEKEFKEAIGNKFADKIAVEYVFQEVEKVPEGIVIPQTREKPWGTGHAILMAKDVIKEPFVVINGDDYYGHEAFSVMAKYLTSLTPEQQNQYAIMGYKVSNTLSENGHVSRGVCEVDKEGFLKSVTERTQIQPTEKGVVFKDEQGVEQLLSPETLVSMNFWGFTPTLFTYLEKMFAEFIKENSQSEKAEFYIPFVIDSLIKSGEVKVKVLSSGARWFGVTYKEDKPMVIEKIYKLCCNGIYPMTLWK